MDKSWAVDSHLGHCFGGYFSRDLTKWTCGVPGAPPKQRGSVMLEITARVMSNENCTAMGGIM